VVKESIVVKVRGTRRRPGDSMRMYISRLQMIAEFHDPTKLNRFKFMKLESLLHKKKTQEEEIQMLTPRLRRA